MLQANGKGKCTKRPQDFNSESCKRVKQEQSDETGETSGVAYSLQESSSPVDSLDLQVPHYDDLDSSHCQHRAENIKLLAEIWFEFNDIDLNEKRSKEQNKTHNFQLNEILRAEIALRNTSGGVLILNTKQKVTVKNRDEWMKQLYEKRKTLLGSECGEEDSFDDIIDVKSEDFAIYIYVRSSSVAIITNDSNLRQRSVGRNYPVKMYSRICKVLQKKKPKCICAHGKKFITSFKKGDKLSHESETEEHKRLTSENLPKALCEKLSDNIVAFANTQGGTVYFGIEDKDSSIVGQRFKDKDEKNYIYHCIKECVKRKLWIKDSGEREDPEENNHYHVGFFPVDGADEDTYVIAVHICQYDGTAVFSKAPECSVVSKDNDIIDLDLRKWLALHKSTPIGNRGYRNRFERRERGTSAYFSVKETVEKFVDDLKSALPGHLKVHPVHAMNWIHHQTLNMFVELIKKKFKENSFRGVAYIERCWEVNLGLPCTKPADVICDLLLCSPQMPLVLVSLTSDIPNEITSMYNKKVAKKLKATLVQEAGCLEKFYVKPITISHQWLESAENVSSIYSDMPEYPDTYRMSEDKYTKILEALVLVLARANIMATHVIGQGLFNLLTYEQYKILHEFYENSNKVKITGPPGSGKTVLALERMHRLRKSGCSYDEVFFLCSYKPLKARVGNITMPHDGEPLCIAKTYYEFAPLIESEENVHPTLDNVKHILADEAQNFQDFQETSLDWWSKLNGMCDKMKDSSFWVFFDPSQKVNNKRSVSLREFSQNNLKTVIRTTGEIHRFITGQKYMSVGTDVKLGHDLEGEKVEVLVPLESFLVEKSKHLVYILISQLHKLIFVDGYNENRITVLFTSIADRNEYQKLFLEQTSNCSVRNGEELSKSGVIFDTIRRYSGEENDIIIGFCPEYYTSGAQNNNALMVSLCSRAKFKLILIFKNETVAINFNLKGWKNVEYGNLNAVNNFKL